MLTNHVYASLDELKHAMHPNGVTTLADDDALLRTLEAMSRALDRFYEGRHYYPRTATRYSTAEHGGLLFVEDLLSVTTLKTDSDGDRTYETTWTTTDYDLEPYNAPDSAPPRPYTRICPSPNGAYRFPSTRRGIEIAGSWGYYDVRRTASATLNEALDTSETGVDVTNGMEFSPGHTLLIDSEQMPVRYKDGATLTVTRGANGTTASTHTSGATIQIYEYPTINEVLLLMAHRMSKRGDAIFGVMGSAEMGQILTIAKHDPDVVLLMQPFRKASI